MKSVRVTDYDPAWPDLFRQVSDLVWPAVADVAVSIEHIGSTAVPGLAAKPVIDIDLVIRAPHDLPAVVHRLAALGYRHRGNLGIEGRDAFRAPADSSVPHHLYVCAAGSLPLRNHLALRDHLRANPADAAAYDALKRNLAAQHPHDMDRYIEGKSHFILEILRSHGLTPSDLSAIAASNLSPPAP